MALALSSGLSYTSHVSKTEPEILNVVGVHMNKIGGCRPGYQRG